MNSKKRTENKNHKFDIGLALLKFILSFLVVITHCYESSYAEGIWKLIFIKADCFFFHVRTFFILSLYFSYNTLVSPNLTKKVERLERLVIPYFIWPLIIYFINNWIIMVLIKVKDYRWITLNELIFQLISGHGFIYTLWFQLNLIVISILFILIISLFRGSYNFILLLLGIISFILQYNQMNLIFFNRFNDKRRKAFGRIVEVFPSSVTGFLIASSQVLTLLKKYRRRAIIVCFHIIYLLVNFQIFSETKGFGNEGFKLYFLSIFIFILFSMFPFEIIKNERIIKIIKIITNHTAGVYFIHVPVYEYTSAFIMPIKIKSIIGCIIVYLISYFICHIGSYYFEGTKLRNLFA